MVITQLLDAYHITLVETNWGVKQTSLSQWITTHQTCILAQVSSNHQANAAADSPHPVTDMRPVYPLHCDSRHLHSNLRIRKIH